jgi:hypothetical protein
MTPPAHPARYKNHHLPGKMISHSVWLYYRFTWTRPLYELSFVDREVLSSQQQVGAL